MYYSSFHTWFSFGKKFNKVGGGAYALLWTEGYFEVWFWKKKRVPKDVSSGKISMSMER